MMPTDELAQIEAEIFTLDAIGRALQALVGSGKDLCVAIAERDLEQLTLDALLRRQQGDTQALRTIAQTVLMRRNGLAHRLATLQ